MFANNTELIYDDFSCNYITKVDSLTFAGALTLNSNNISYNLLTAIPWNVFAKNGELQAVDFLFNKINEKSEDNPITRAASLPYSSN